jgi:undecaprenyl-diphosphatase
MRNLDERVFHWINNWPEALSPFFWFLSEATKITPGRILLLGLILTLLIVKKTRKATIYALISVGLANELTDFIKWAFPMARPCVELSGVHLRTGLLTSFGTASAHSANMAAVAAVFLLLHGRWGLIWLFFAVATGLSRIYVGVHYPSQVLLGLGCGILMGDGVVRLGEWLLPKLSRRKDDQGTEKVAVSDRADSGNNSTTDS